MPEIKTILQAIQEGISHAEREMLKIDGFSARDKIIAQFAASKAVHVYINDEANKPNQPDPSPGGRQVNGRVIQAIGDLWI